MKKTRNTAFIVELLVMFIILLFVIVVITQVFVTARGKSLDAKHLTEAVNIAESVAETDLSASDTAAAIALFEGMEQVEEVREEADGYSLRIRAGGETKDCFEVAVERAEEAGTSGTYTNGTVTVFYEDGSEPVYVLTTGNYRSGGGQ